MTSFRKSSHIPIYRQLKNCLLERIHSGQYQEGEKIPTEIALSEDFKVSRPTVRQALRELTTDGFLERKPGRGTYLKRTHASVVPVLNILAPDYHADLIIRPLVKLYCSKHPDARLRVVEAPFDAIHQYINQEFIQHSGNVDLLMMPYSHIPAYALSGKLEMLDSYIKQNNLDYTIDYLKDRKGAPVIESTCAFNLLNHGYATFGIPFQNDVYVLTYRKDLFDLYGLKEPKTPLEYRKVAKTLTGAKDPDGRVVPYGTALNGKHMGADLAEDLIVFFWAFGGQIFDKNLHPVINSPAGCQALEFYKELLSYAPPSCVDWGVLDSIRAMREGQVAMMLNWSSLIGELEDPRLSHVSGKLGYALFPTTSPQVAGWELAISYDSRHKQESFDFIKYVTSTDPEVSQVYLESGVLPYRPSMLSQAAYIERRPYCAIVEEAWQKGRTWGRYRENRAMMEVMSLYAGHVLSGILSPEDALEKIADTFEILVRQDAQFKELADRHRLRLLG